MQGGMRARRIGRRKRTAKARGKITASGRRCAPDAYVRAEALPPLKSRRLLSAEVFLLGIAR